MGEPKFKVGDQVRKIDTGRLGVIVEPGRWFLGHWIYYIRWEDTGVVDRSSEYMEGILELIEPAPVRVPWLAVVVALAIVAIVVSTRK